MDSDGLPIVGSGIDYTKVGAIHQKRTLAFLNHFITHTVRFLNRFSCVCDDKLANLSLRIQRLETTISNLEAKLSSIPGLENVTVQTSSTAPTTTTSQNPEPEKKTSEDKPEESTDKEETPPPAPEEPVTITVSQDPVYAKFFKMVQMGVPPAALRMKMQAEGLDPDLLETPNAPSPNSATAKTAATTAANDDDDDDDDASVSSDSSGFSD